MAAGIAANLPLLDSAAPQRHDPARIIQLDGEDLARGYAVEIDRAAAAQPAGRAALEHHAQLAPALGGAPFLHAEHAAERHGDDRQRRRSDDKVARACHVAESTAKAEKLEAGRSVK